MWIDIEKPFWWDVPAWLASGQMDSIGLANNHMHRGGMFADEAWGRPRDKARLPEPHGQRPWTQEIYYHVLNCGLRLPPSAGSASGVLPNPVGYNRVYVHVDGEWRHDKWWRGLKAGRSFVTNGPLLLCKADGKLPGHVFRVPEGGRDGHHAGRAAHFQRPRPPGRGREGRSGGGGRRAERRRHATGEGPGLLHREWLVPGPRDHREPAAPSASPRPRRSTSRSGPRKATVRRASAQFFLDWAVEREKRVRAARQTPEQRDEVLRHHEAALRYWEERVARADAP